MLYHYSNEFLYRLERAFSLSGKSFRFTFCNINFTSINSLPLRKYGRRGKVEAERISGAVQRHPGTTNRKDGQSTK